MEMQHIELEENLKMEKQSEQNLTSDNLNECKIIEENNENEENKNVKDSPPFETIIHSNNEPLCKADLEIATTEFIIDEDNYNISPNTTIDPSVDPLAIDDFNVEENPSSLIDSQFNISKDIIYIVDVDDIKDNTNSIKVSSLEDIHKTINRNEGVNQNDLNLISNQKSSLGNEESELPSDGSDSGLGLDSNLLQLDSYHNLHNSISIIDKTSTLNPTVTNIPNKSSLKRLSNSLDETNVPPLKRGKKSIQFDNVKIFYFPRIQGFCCVPSQGGCTLGMEAKHVQSKTYKLCDHVSELNGDDKPALQLCNAKNSSSDETDSDEDLSEENISDLDPDSSGFLQPVPIKTRRALLKAAGIKKIDSTEKDECRAIRTSREYCGCLCRGFCDPDTCSCSQSGIKCQVDRPNFPCGCTRDGCGNIQGRVEFNPNRVRTHFIHTLMRLDIENKSKSTFIQEIPITRRFFPNSSEINYGNENSNFIQNGLQFFPDTLSVTNHDNFDLFPLHNGGESSRLALSSPTSDINDAGEISYPVLKSYLSPTNNYPDDTTDTSKSIKISEMNNRETLACENSDNNEAKYLVHYTNYATQNYESFSSAYTSFLEECETAYQISKDDINEKTNNEISELTSSNLNYNSNTLEISPMHDLLNINRNNSLPFYSASTSDEIHKNDLIKEELNNTIPNLENCPITKVCTLAPTAHTSTSIFEGTSTSAVSKYVTSPSKPEKNDTPTSSISTSTSAVSKYVTSPSKPEKNGTRTSTTDCNSTTITNPVSKCDLEPNNIELNIPIYTVENKNSNSDILHDNIKDEKEFLKTLLFTSPIVPNGENSTGDLITSEVKIDVAEAKNETKKEYQISNSNSNCSNSVAVTVNIIDVIKES